MTIADCSHETEKAKKRHSDVFTHQSPTDDRRVKTLKSEIFSKNFLSDILVVIANFLLVIK